MINEITNEFEKEVYLKYIKYMEIPDCDKAYDMFFRDVIKTQDLRITPYLLETLYKPFDINTFREKSNENKNLLIEWFTIFNNTIT